MGLSLRAGLAAAAGMGALLCAAGPALAEIDPPVRAALDQVQAGRAQEAYRALSPLVGTRAGDKDFDYAFGLAAVDAGHALEGILAFQRILAQEPTNGPARAELARAYAMAGDIDTARREFDTVVEDPSLPDPVRRRLNGVVGQLSRAESGGGLDISGYAELQGGYDSNINTATSQNQLLIPLFSSLGPAQLSPGATEMDDSFVQASGGISLVYGASRQTRLFASLLATLRENIDDDAFDQQALTATTGLAHTLAGRDVLSASAQYQPFWIGGAHYRDTVGVVGQFTHPLAGGAALALGVQAFRLDYETDPLRDAKRYGASVTYSGRTLVASIQGGKEETDSAAADAQSFRYGGLSAALEHPLTASLALVASAGIEARRYDAADVLFLTRRSDEQYDASLGLKIRIGDGAVLRPQVTWTRNASNIALYDYDRVTLSVAVRKEF